MGAWGLCVINSKIKSQGNRNRVISPHTKLKKQATTSVGEYQGLSKYKKITQERRMKVGSFLFDIPPTPPTSQCVNAQGRFSFGATLPLFMLDNPTDYISLHALLVDLGKFLRQYN